MLEQEHKLSPVSSEGFRALSWKEQLSLVKLKIEDPVRYDKEVLKGVSSDKALVKMIDDLAFLLQESARKLPKLDTYPITLVPHWIACSGYLNYNAHHKTLSQLKIGYKYFVNTFLLKVPMLVVSSADRPTIKFLDYACSSAMNQVSAGFNLFKFKTYVDLDLQGNPLRKTEDFNHAVTSYSRQYETITCLEDLLGLHPCVSTENYYANLFCSGDMLLYWAKAKELSELVICPVLPRDLSGDGFRFSNWHLLL